MPAADDPTPWARGAVEADAAVLDALRAHDDVGILIERHGAYRWGLHPPFRSLVRSVTYQSVSTASAAAVFARLEHAVDLTPSAVLAADRARLRDAGLSWTKVDTLERVAAFAADGGLDGIATLDDAGVEARLTSLKGIGPWTADMFLFFCLGRMDVWPVGDLAVRQQAERIFGVEGRAAVTTVGQRFRPYRSPVAWYLWQESRRRAAT